MATTYTSRLNLGKPASGDRNWGDTANATFDAIEALGPIGALNAAPAETPSASLNIRVAAGLYQKSDGSIASYAGTSSQAVTGGSTSAVYLDGSGTLTVAASYPSAPHTRIATVTATSTITAIQDDRTSSVPLLTYLPLSGGALADGANLAVGATTGTMIGTASGQKIGFLGATPVARQTFGAATAGGTYAAAEQAMLQKCYDALRAFGLGS